MTESEQLIEALDRRVQRREERRDFFKMALGAAAVGAGTLAFANTAQAQSAADIDIGVLNFALNLEYLEAQFYSYAYSGSGLSSDLLGGVTTTGARGDVKVGTTNPARKVDFTGEPTIGQYAREIAQDEINHVKFLRTALASAAVAQPAIDISGDASGPFTTLAKAAGVPLTNGVFDPYASPENFLLGAFVFEDVGVTAYKGSSILLSNNAYLDAAAGILAVEAFHAGIIRGALYRRGSANGSTVWENARKLSDARDLVDGTTTAAGTATSPTLFADDDQGVASVQTSITSSAGTTTATASNFAPTDANGLAYSRTAQQVLNVVYENTATAAATMGGFFPAGVNGTFRTSAAK